MNLLEDSLERESFPKKTKTAVIAQQRGRR
jgi:hypothetical protein